MSTIVLDEQATERAQKIWDVYVSEHDLSDRIGSAAGIDPASGKIWFGSSALDISLQLKEAGISKPLFFVRVGSKTYLRKGGRR